MRACHAIAAVALALLGQAGPAAAQNWQVPVCPSLPLAQQQSQQPAGSPLANGCRMVGVRRVEGPTGPICAVDFSENGQGLFADIMDSTVQTRWWTPCANLNPPGG